MEPYPDQAAANVKIIQTQLSDPAHQTALVALIDEYPMKNGSPPLHRPKPYHKTIPLRHHLQLYCSSLRLHGQSAKEEPQSL
jgi:hypothetical protein